VAPTGGSIRTKDATSGEGPGADYAAAAIWADELPWAADTFGDAAIEAAGLDEHLDNWRDADPASGWEFSQPDAAIMVEDFTLNRADETSVGVGTPTTVTDLDFTFADAGILALSRNFLRDTQTEDGTGGTLFDLSETQGTPTTIGSGSVSSGSFIKVLEFWRVVDATVEASVPIDTSIAMSAVSASTLQYQWIVHRYNSAGVLQESSTPSSAHNTVGVKTQTMVLTGPFVAGDKLAVSLWLRKAGGGGSRSFTLSINHAFSFVEFSVAEAGPEEHSGSGTATGITLVASSGTGSPAIAGTGQVAGTTLAPETGTGTPAVVGAGEAAGTTLIASAGTGAPAIAGTGQTASLVLTAGTGTGAIGGAEHSGNGNAASLALAAASGSGSPAATGTGQGASLTLSVDLGAGFAAIDAAGNSTGTVLVASIGEGFPTVVGTGQAVSLVITPAEGTGTPAIVSDGSAAGITLTAGVGQGGLGAEQHSGEGLTSNLVLASELGEGVPAVSGGGIACSIELVTAQGAGSLATTGVGSAANLILAAGIGGSAVYVPSVERTLSLPVENRTLAILSESRVLQISTG
jgi:hypothetical protein